MIMEQQTLVKQLEDEKEKAKEAIKDIINDYYNITGLMITKIEVERLNSSTLCGYTSSFGDVILFTEQ